LMRREPHSVVVSARTGLGMDDLLAAIERDLPSGLVDVDIEVPYARGDLISRAHRTGEVLSEEHGELGTRLRARVPEALAGELVSLQGGHGD
ncbi:MAG TPA: GTPase HflX, partial [Actinobacteria bacterium]|nr:GTPase HflX [Actinomycetota bacterium]